MRSSALLTSSKKNGAVHLTGRARVESLSFATTASGGTAVIFDNAKNFAAVNLLVNQGFQTGLQLMSGSNGNVSGSTIQLGKNSVGISATSCATLKLAGNNWLGESHTSNKNINGVVVSNSSNVTVSDRFAQTDLGIHCSNSQNVTVSKSRFEPADTAMIGQNITNLIASNNNVSGFSEKSGVGFQTFGCTEVKFMSNDVQQIRRPFLTDSDSDMLIELNTVKDVGSGIQVSNETDVTVRQNSVRLSQSVGIEADASTGKVEILDNDVNNCGMGKGPTLAAIEVNCPTARTIQIRENLYSGGIHRLQYYIRCFQESPQAILVGNITNSLLPSKEGP
jgi:hypothetical protein